MPEFWLEFFIDDDFHFNAGHPLWWWWLCGEMSSNQCKYEPSTMMQNVFKILVLLGVQKESKVWFCSLVNAGSNFNPIESKYNHQLTSNLTIRNVNSINSADCRAISNFEPFRISSNYLNFARKLNLGNLKLAKYQIILLKPYFWPYLKQCV